MSILTEADEQILITALRENGGYGLATDWYLYETVPLPKQWAFHHAPSSNVTWLGGIASGKTRGVAASYFIDCLSIPYFQALNTSVTSVQAELAFEMAMEWVESNERLDHLIDNVALRPYPRIDFKNYSSWIFRTAGKDARFIRGQEFDRINYDEAGLDYDGVSLKTLRGRLRGVRLDGHTRMARLDVTTSPTDAPWLRERFYRGVAGHHTADLRRYNSLRSTIYENTHLTAEQIELMESDYTDEMIDVELLGMFPDYGMTTFPRNHVDACTRQEFNDMMTEATRPEQGRAKPGWREEVHPRHGITHFEAPPEHDAIYLLAGDPGTGDPPKRNAGCVIVARVDRKPFKVVYFDWVYGRGSYAPFLSSFKYAIDKYAPVYKGIDTTGTQKALDELAFENEGIVVDGINFASDKNAIINSLSVAVTNHWFEWPLIKGLLFQMRHYRRDLDTQHSSQPQDIVMTLGIVSFLARYMPGEIEEAAKVRRHRGRPSRRYRSSRGGRIRRR
jgi:hypothetical protein